MPAILYKDIGKIAFNILSDDYDFSRKLKVKTKTQNGVSFTTEGAMGSNKSILAKLGASFNHSSGINVSKLQVTTQGRLIGEADIANALVDNVKLTFKLEDGVSKGNAKQVGKIGAEYVQDTFSVNTEVDFSGNSVHSAGVFHYNNFLVGGHSSFSIEKSNVSEYGGAISYGEPDFHINLLTKNMCKNLTVSMNHFLYKNVCYSAVYDYNVKSAANTLTLGGRYISDATTTYCGKINSEGIMSLACVQKLRPYVALTTSAQIDAKNFDGDAHKFGFGLTLG